MSMPSPPRYKTALAFRHALLAHLRKRAREQQVDPQRLHYLVSFDRFLARLFPDDRVRPPWLLKGGYAVELRLPGRARSTEDIDLLIPDPSILASTNPNKGLAVRELLQDAAANNLHDWFTFRVGEPKQGLEGPPEGGFRFKIATDIGDADLFCIFQVDVSLGDSVTGDPQWVTGEDWLDFAGLPGVVPARVALSPMEQQFAEKVHAVTVPRGKQNSRVQDLIDLVLFIEAGQLDAARVVQSAQITFSLRKTHDLPVRLDMPSETWRQPYAALAAECSLNAKTLEDGFKLVSVYCGQLSLS